MYILFIMPFLVAKLLYNSLSPSVSQSVRCYWENVIEVSYDLCEVTLDRQSVSKSKRVISLFLINVILLNL